MEIIIQGVIFIVTPLVITIWLQKNDIKCIENFIESLIK